MGGDLGMALERELGGLTVSVEWQLSSPSEPSAAFEADGEDRLAEEATDFCVTVARGQLDSEMVFYCSTKAGEDYRFAVGNVSCFPSRAERESGFGYDGPQFEDLGTRLQEALETYLTQVGVDAELCDFIDAM